MRSIGTRFRPFRRRDSGGQPTTAAPEPRPATPDERAEALIGGIVAGDVAEQQDVVRRRRATLALQRRFRPRHRSRMITLQAELRGAERYLAVLQERRAAWERHRTFDRNLVERVLLVARIADRRDAGARAWSDTRNRIDGARPGYVWVGAHRSGSPADEPPSDRGETLLHAVVHYLRTHHPPVDRAPTAE